MLGLQQRQRVPEEMDQPGLSPAEHIRALQGLARLNAVGFAASMLWSPLRRLAQQLQPRPLTVLDIATGAGDVPLRLAAVACRQGISLKITGIDFSPTAIDTAQALAERRGLPAEFLLGDVVSDPLPGKFDVIMCSLFLHHLDDSDAVSLLRKMRDAANHLVLVSDLQRSALNLWLVRIASRIVTRSKIVHIDGERSVRAALSITQLREFADQAGMKGARISVKFPCRMLLQWHAK